MSRDGATTAAGYPEAYDIPALGDRRLMFTARIMTLAFIVSVCANIALAMALFALTPLKEVRPFIVNFADADGVVATVRPVTKDYEGLPLLLEALSKQYVVLRHSIVASDTEMERRWGAKGSELQLMSSPEEYRRFLRQTTAQFAELRKAGTTRDVQVDAVNASVPGRSYIVDFTIFSKDPNGTVIERSSWIATLEVELRPKTVTRDTRLVNPTGFTVLNYTLSRKNSETPR